MLFALFLKSAFAKLKNLHIKISPVFFAHKEAI